MKMNARRKNKLKLFGGIAGIILICVFSFFSIRVKNIKITGNVQNTEDNIKKTILGDSSSPCSAWLYLKNKFRPHEKIPFVEKYDIEFQSLTNITINIYEKKIIGYFYYMSRYCYFDKDGIVIEISTKLIEDVPQITGLTFKYAIEQEKLPTDNDKIFERILNVTKLIKKNEINANKIYINKNDNSVTLYIKNVTVNLGNDDMLSEKMSDLQGIQSKIEKKRGTLNMIKYREDGNYILKQDATSEKTTK